MLHTLIDFLRTLTDPDRLIHLLSTVVTGWYGYALLMAIVFVETGLVVMPFLPGDSLLFAMGALSARAGSPIDLWLAAPLLCLAAVLGDAANYSIGYWIGPKVFTREQSRWLNKRHLLRRRSSTTSTAARRSSTPSSCLIIRTFAPFVAGVAGMPYSRFLPFDIIGGVGWVTSMTTLGYLLGGIPMVRRNFEKFVLLVVIVSLLPVLIHALRARRENKAAV